MNSVLLKTDITCLKFYKEYIFIAIGNYLYIYDIRGNFISKKLIFHGQKINGIFCNNKDIIFYGANHIAQYLIFETDNIVSLKFIGAWLCNDWILFAKLLNNSSVVVVSAHNVIYRLDIVNKSLFECSSCEEKCILYCANIVTNDKNDVIILAGTVFSEILIWKPFHTLHKDEPVLHRLRGHSGVVFSITYDMSKRFICSTSDDRTVRIWSTNSDKSFYEILEDTKSLITLQFSLYGHSARVWKSLIIKNKIISVGEDSVVNIWDINGNFIRKFQPHPNECIWSLDCNNDYILTGGGDTAVRLHPLDIDDKLICRTFSYTETIKKVVFFSENDIVVFTEKGKLLFKTDSNQNWMEIAKYELLKNVQIDVTKCGTRFAITGSNGIIDIYIKDEKEIKLLKTIFTMKNNPILSVMWLNVNRILVCTLRGLITIIKIDSESYSQCQLPSSKECCVTCATETTYNDLIVGDRVGNIFLYKSNNSSSLELVQTFSKFHSHLGVHYFFWENEENVLTAGRDGLIKKFQYTTDRKLSFITTIKLPFKWCAKIINLSHNNTTRIAAIGFLESKFMMWFLNEDSLLLEIECGGGHRSWDLFYKPDSYQIKFIYIKNKNLHYVHYKDWSQIVSTDIVHSFHAKEINTMSVIQTKQDLLFISGGEDTTLRISSALPVFENVAILRNHLSNVRTIDVCQLTDTDYIIFSGGGRAQLIVSKLTVIGTKIQLSLKINHMIKVENRHCNYSADNDPETRIMDIKSCVNKDNSIIVIAGCSDGFIRTYKLKIENEIFLLTLENQIEYNRRCILKVGLLNFYNAIIIISMATDGLMTFWNLHENLKITQKISSIQVHQSGINSFCYKKLKQDNYLVVTGGDDNSISVLVINLTMNSEKININVIDQWKSDKFHSAQITGLIIHAGYLISSSVDQRLTLLKITLQDSKVKCELFKQYCSTIPDVQGLSICIPKSTSDSICNVCIYGKGIEIIQVFLPMADPIIEVVGGPITLGEGPHWDQENQVLYYVDIKGCAFYKYVPGTGETFKCTVEGAPVTLVVPVKGQKNDFLISHGRKIVVVTWDGKSPKPSNCQVIAEVDKEDENLTNRLNDGKCDPFGRLYAGTMGLEEKIGECPKEKGSFYLFKSTDEPEKLLDKITISNGMAWDLQKQLFYYIDTMRYSVDKFDYDSKTGQISNRKPIYDFKKNNASGLPDGMTIDAVGNLWIACFNGKRVICINPDNGRLLQTIPLPAKQVTSVAFGGPNLDVLFVTTAALESEKDNPEAGKIFKISQLDVKGTPSFSAVI